MVREHIANSVDVDPCFLMSQLIPYFFSSCNVSVNITKPRADPGYCRYEEAASFQAALYVHINPHCQWMKTQLLFVLSDYIYLKKTYIHMFLFHFNVIWSLWNVTQWAFNSGNDPALHWIQTSVVFWEVLRCYSPIIASLSKLLPGAGAGSGLVRCLSSTSFINLCWEPVASWTAQCHVGPGGLWPEQVTPGVCPGVWRVCSLSLTCRLPPPPTCSYSPTLWDCFRDEVGRDGITCCYDTSADAQTALRHAAIAQHLLTDQFRWWLAGAGSAGW